MNRKRLLPILLAAMLLLAAIPVGFAAASTETATAPHSGASKISPRSSANNPVNIFIPPAG